VAYPPWISFEGGCVVHQRASPPWFGTLCRLQACCHSVWKTSASRCAFHQDCPGRERHLRRSATGLNKYGVPLAGLHDSEAEARVSRQELRRVVYECLSRWPGWVQPGTTRTSTRQPFQRWAERVSRFRWLEASKSAQQETGEKKGQLPQLHRRHCLRRCTSALSSPKKLASRSSCTTTINRPAFHLPTPVCRSGVPRRTAMLLQHSPCQCTGGDAGPSTPSNGIHFRVLAKCLQACSGGGTSPRATTAPWWWHSLWEARPVETTLGLHMTQLRGELLFIPCKIQEAATSSTRTGGLRCTRVSPWPRRR